MINYIKTCIAVEECAMSWKIAGLVIGALLGIVVMLYARMPFFFSLPLQIALLLVGGKIGERIGSGRRD